MKHPRLEEFRSLIGTGFALEPSATTLELVDVEEYDLPRLSLIFHGPAEPTLAQATYTFTSAHTDPEAIFIVPIAADANASTYEAIFTAEGG